MEHATTILLSVIAAVAVVIITGIVVVDQFYQHEQGKQFVIDAIAKVEADKEKEGIAMIQQEEKHNQFLVEQGEKMDKLYAACLSKLPGGITSSNQTAILECAEDGRLPIPK